MSLSLTSGSQTATIQNFSENESIHSKKSKNCVVADVVILGCSLPGIVTAHKLKEKFGSSMDIVILDLPRSKHYSKTSVCFRGLDEDDVEDGDQRDHSKATEPAIPYNKALLIKLTKDFSIPVPEFMLNPQNETHFLNKLFENYDGSTVHCTDDFNDFTFLNFLERFELKQYQSYLDCCMMSLFTQTSSASSGREQLMFFDRTSMEEHICWYLLFPTSREIMRITVRLTCGASPDTVSVLFYLHQCFRSNGSKNQIDGDNTMFREKLLGYFRQRLPNKMEENVADITLRIKPIREIRQYSEEQLILETLRGETDYVCNLLAMALNPDQLQSIHFQEELLTRDELTLADKLLPSKTKKFFIQYEDNFWRREGCSGDILSLRGPILWAIEKPRVSVKGSFDKYSGLVGYLKDSDTPSNKENSCKAAVLEQLVNLFGEEAAEPLTYMETDIQDMFIPPRGEYLSLQNLKESYANQKLHWTALDVYANGDIASAIEAGHMAYLQLMKSLRPQAQDFDETRDVQTPVVFNHCFFKNALAKVNFPFCLQVLGVTAGAYLAFNVYKLFRNVK